MGLLGGFPTHHLRSCKPPNSRSLIEKVRLFVRVFDSPQRAKCLGSSDSAFFWIPETCRGGKRIPRNSFFFWGLAHFFPRKKNMGKILRLDGRGRPDLCSKQNIFTWFVWWEIETRCTISILHKDVLHKHPVSYFVKRHNHTDPVYTNMKG